MNTTPSIALSGMQAAQTRLRAAAHNVANLSTDGFRRQEVQQSARSQGGVRADVVRSSVPGPDLVRDTVERLQAKNAFMANLAVFKTSDTLAGALLDTRA
ncbi:flagellar basal body protein [Comamonadaceae bacterium G21597-S1]|nr:flagellar basal body protein [Comamonadaceae bacterium G21597-S1]